MLSSFPEASRSTVSMYMAHTFRTLCKTAEVYSMSMCAACGIIHPFNLPFANYQARKFLSLKTWQKFLNFTTEGLIFLKFTGGACP